jgi:hypothetical protein
MAEEEWPFEDRDPDWNYCMGHSTFTHNDGDACEFIIHIGSDWEKEDSFFQNKLRDMKKYSCSESFMAAYKKAAESGAMRVLFYC